MKSVILDYHSDVQIRPLLLGQCWIFSIGPIHPDSNQLLIDIDAAYRAPGVPTYHSAQDINAIVRDYTKWDDQPYSLDDVPDSFIRGYRIATTDPTAPVYINYDADIQEDAVKAMTEIPDVSRYSKPAPAQASAN